MGGGNRCSITIIPLAMVHVRVECETQLLEAERQPCKGGRSKRKHKTEMRCKYRPLFIVIKESMILSFSVYHRLLSQVSVHSLG